MSAEIKTWRERMRESGQPFGYRHIEMAHINAEIADLRAALAAATAPQPVVGSAGLLASVRDLDSIGMQFGADLTKMPTVTIKGADYLPREEVMGRLAVWRREWDANSKARPDPRAAQPVAGDERADFEVELIEMGFTPIAIEHDRNGVYYQMDVRMVRKGWVAGRAQSARHIATLHAVIAEQEQDASTNAP